MKKPRRTYLDPREILGYEQGDTKEHELFASFLKLKGWEQLFAMSRSYRQIKPTPMTKKHCSLNPELITEVAKLVKEYGKVREDNRPSINMEVVCFKLPFKLIVYYDYDDDKRTIFTFYIAPREEGWDR